MMLVIMTMLYLVQTFFAITKAAKEPERAQPRQSILVSTCGGQVPLIKSWISAATIMVFPPLLTWFLGFFHSTISPQNFGNVVAYTGSVALLTTLVTVELTLLQDLRGTGELWRSMLVIALALDVLSLFIFVAFIGGFVDKIDWGLQDPYAAVLIGIMAGAACLSSFLIILFAKVANSFSFPAAAPESK